MARFDRLLARLQRFYGLLPQPPRDPFAFFVWETLSARTTPARRDRAFAALRRVPALTPDAVIRTPLPKLAEVIALAGPYMDERLAAIRAGAETFRRSAALRSLALQRLATARRAAAALPQMERVAARRFLLFTIGRVGLPPDPRLVRVGRRLGFGGDERGRRGDRAVVRALTMLAGQLDDCRRTYLYLAHHADATCTAAPHCTVCPLRDDCPEGQSRLMPGVS